MEFRKVVRRRHMTRSYDSRPIPDDVVTRVLDAGRRAPSAGFSQGVTFLVLNTPAATANFWHHVSDDPAPGGRWDRLRVAPAIVLPLGDPKVYLDRYAEPDKAPLGLQHATAWPVPYWQVDAAFSAMSILLAATDEGLGALFFGLATGEAGVRDDLGIPDRIGLIGAITLGYPASDDPPSPSLRRGWRPAHETVHWGQWTEPPPGRS